jgi:hypothetical protein
LKQLQLIQILCINAPTAAALEQVAAKIPGVNRLRRASNTAKAASELRTPPFKPWKSAILGGWRFTAR